MNLKVIRVLNVFIAALLAGSLFGSLTGYNPGSLSAVSYVEQQQNAIRSLNTLMPLLGLITIILTIIAAFYQRKNKKVFITLLIATVLLLISALITKFGNQPINAIVMTWNKADIPVNWTDFRDRWWSLHVIRAISALIALLLITVASIRKD